MIRRIMACLGITLAAVVICGCMAFVITGLANATRPTPKTYVFTLYMPGMEPQTFEAQVSGSLRDHVYEGKWVVFDGEAGRFYLPINNVVVMEEYAAETEQ